MDFRRTILWVVFLMSTMFVVDGWQRYNGGTGFMGNNTQKAPATAPLKPNTSAPAADVVTAAQAKVGATETVPTSNVAPNVAQATGKIINLKNDVLSIDVDTAGGNIVRAELLKHLDEVKANTNMVLLQTGAKQYVAQTGFTGAMPNHTAQTVFNVVSQQTSGVVLESTVNGVKVTKTIELQPNNYGIDVKHTLLNGTTASVEPTLYLQILRHGGAVTEGNALTSPTSTFTGPAIYTDEKKFQKIDFADIEKGKTKFQNTSKDNEPAWISMIQHYFVTAWVPKVYKAREIETMAINGADGTSRYYRVTTKQALGAVAPNASVSNEATLYIGPQDQEVLERLAPGLDLVVDYGILTIVAKPIFAGLKFFHGITNNWGWAIILLTIAIKALLYLPMAMSYRSMAKMKLVAPKMKELQAKYADDRQKLNTSMMELYRTEKINPLGGCLPILLTIPIFIALYWVLLASVEMRNAPWIGWITNLAAPDHWYVLPVLLALTMWAQFKLSPTPPDPMQARVMMVMQGVFAIMFLFFPAGLNLYYLVNNILSIAQQWFITRQLEKAGLQERVVKKKK